MSQPAIVVVNILGQRKIRGLFEEEILMSLSIGRKFSSNHICAWGLAAIVIWKELREPRALILNTERGPGPPSTKWCVCLCRVRCWS